MASNGVHRVYDRLGRRVCAEVDDLLVQLIVRGSHDHRQRRNSGRAAAIEATGTIHHTAA